jgi:hypothetical protein
MAMFIAGLFIGAIIGVFAMALCVASRDNVTVTYSGYQPKIDNKSISPEYKRDITKLYQKYADDDTNYVMSAEQKSIS